MPAKRPDKQTTIYGIWDPEMGEWWVAARAKAAWTHPTFAKRAFTGAEGIRFDDQDRCILVAIGPNHEPIQLTSP